MTTRANQKRVNGCGDGQVLMFANNRLPRPVAWVNTRRDGYGDRFLMYSQTVDRSQPVARTIACSVAAIVAATIVSFIRHIKDFFRQC